MNSHKRNILSLAVLSCFQSVQGESTDTGGNTQPEQAQPQTTLPEVPAPVTTGKPQQHGIEWQDNGKALAASILASEQNVGIALETLSTTKINGLIALAELADAEARTMFIAGAQLAFAGADGDKIGKAHNNYLTEMRRVSAGVKLNGPEGILKVLKDGKGGYADRIKELPRASATVGGQNLGTGASAVLTQVRNAIAQGADPMKLAGTVAEVAEQLKNPPQPEQETQQGRPGAKPVESSAIIGAGNIDKGQQSAPGRVSSMPDMGTKDLTAIIQNGTHDSQLEAIGVAYANRCKRSGNPDYQNLGAAILDLLDGMEASRATGGVHAPSEAPAPMAGAQQ